MNTLPKLTHEELVNVLIEDYPKVDGLRNVDHSCVDYMWNWEFGHLMLAFTQEVDEGWRRLIWNAMQDCRAKNPVRLINRIQAMQGLLSKV